MPGLGQLYAGAARRGALVWLATRAAAAAVLWLAVSLPGPLGLGVEILGGLAIVGIAAADAARVAGRAPPDYRRRPYNRGIVYAAIVAAAAAAYLPWRMLLGAYVADTMRIPTGTMAPTLLAGDRVFTVPRRGPTLRHGEVVVYRLWGTRYVKRVAAVPGDTVAMRRGTLWVNGHPQAEPYAIHVGEGEIPDRQFAWQQRYQVPIAPDASPGASPGAAAATAATAPATRPTLATWGPLAVPPHAFFLLGDNRGESVDSRYHGFVADSAIVERPVMLFFSRDPATGHVRWTRIGWAIGSSEPSASAAGPG